MVRAEVTSVRIIQIGAVRYGSKDSTAVGPRHSLPVLAVAVTLGPLCVLVPGGEWNCRAQISAPGVWVLILGGDKYQEWSLLLATVRR